MELPDDPIVEICKKMEIPTLVNFIKTNKLNYKLCQPILIDKIKQNLYENYDDYLLQIYNYIDEINIDDLKIYLEGINSISPTLLRRMLNQEYDGNPMLYILEKAEEDREYIDILKLFIEYGANIKQIIKYIPDELILYFNDLINYAKIKIPIPMKPFGYPNYIEFVDKGLTEGIFKIPRNTKKVKRFYQDLYDTYEELLGGKKRINELILQKLEQIQNILSYL
jgi:hypothetical protein